MKSINWTDHILNFLAVILGVSLAFYISSASEERKAEAEWIQEVQAFLEETGRDRLNDEAYQVPENAGRIELLEQVNALIKSEKKDAMSKLNTQFQNLLIVDRELISYKIS